MAIWHNAAMEYATQGIGEAEIARKIEAEFGLSNMYNAVHGYIWRQTKKTKKQPEETKQVAVQNLEPEHLDGEWGGDETITFGLMGDPQFGSKYVQITHLHEFYDLCAKRGIRTVYNTGDITDGLKMRVGHEQEMYVVSADALVDDVVKNYPSRNGITTYFITGNHDASLIKHVGYDIGPAIAKERPDMVYLGRDCAVVDLTPNCTLELRHPWNGSAYAISYQIQKMIDAMDSDSKPSILAVGHYHKAEYLFYRNIHTIQTGCFQAQTSFMKGKGLAAHMGGWIVTVKVDKFGTISSIVPEFIPIYSSIKEDYKNFTR